MKCNYSSKCTDEAVPGMKLCQTHRELRAEKSRNYRKDYPDKCKEYDAKKDKSKKSEYNKKYRMENADKLKEQQRIAHQNHYKLNKDQIKARNRKWVKDNKEKQCDRVARYRTRKIAAYVAEVDRLTIFERDGWICQLCFKPIDRTAPAKHPFSPSIDHIIALDSGGTHEPGNVQTAHLVCNLTRNRKSVTRHLEIELGKMGVSV